MPYAQNWRNNLLNAVKPLSPVLPSGSNENELKEEQMLTPLSEAALRMPVPVSRATMWRWLKQYPGLGLQIGGRNYIWDTAAAAIARGVPIAEASKLVGASDGRRTA